MAKIILGTTPKNFSKELTFPMLDGTVGSVKPTFKYRTRTQFAAFHDEMLDVIKAEAEAEIKALKAKRKAADEAAAAGAEVDDTIDLGKSETESASKLMERQADFIMDCVNDWDLAVPFDRAAVLQLADEVPQAVSMIIKSYREAMTEGRLGN